MKRLILSIRDKKAEQYHLPYCVPTIGVAYRDLQDHVRSGENHAVSKHPEDFDVYQIGVFDDETGEIDAIQPTRLCAVADFVEIPV